MDKIKFDKNEEIESDKIDLNQDKNSGKKMKVATIKERRKVDLFDILNYLIFIIIALIVVIPIWKVVVDSFNQVSV